MTWVMAAVGVACVGLLVLAYCSLRLFVAVRSLAGELDRARRRLAPRGRR